MLKVGVSKQKITPKLGTLLAGYPWERPASGVADDLDVSAIALSCESEMVLLISATVTEISTPILDEIKEKIMTAFNNKDK